MKRYLFPLLCTLLLALLLSACGTKADNMSNDFQNDMQNGVQDEVPPVDAVEETGVPLTTGMELDAGEFLDEDVLQIWYGQSKTLLVQKSDGLYWYDVETSDLLAYGAGENWMSVDYYPLDSGFCAIGMLDISAASSGTMMAATGTETTCVFYDETLTEVDRLTVDDLLTDILHVDCAAVSSDGAFIAFTNLEDGLYLYSQETQDVTKLMNIGYEYIEINNGLSSISYLFFDETHDQLIFVGSSSGTLTYGHIGFDGVGFENISFEDFDGQGASGYAGGRLFFEENLFSVTGKMAIVDVSTMAQTIYTHTAAEGNGGLYSSQLGGYFATAVLDKNKAVIRLYKTEDDSLCLEYTIGGENEAHFYRPPSVYTLDDLNLCVVKMGGFSGIPARIVLISF